MSGKIDIRKGRLSDSPTIVDFNCRLAFETEDKKLDLPTITRGVDRALRHPDLCQYYVATIDEKIVGQTMITYELTDWRDGIIWWIQSVYVDSEFRGLGVFTKIYQTIMDDAKTAGDAKCIRLYVEVENQKAMSTYFRLGMADAGYKVLEATVEPNSIKPNSIKPNSIKPVTG